MAIMKRKVRNCGRTIAILVFVAIVSGWRAFGAGEETDRPVLPPPAKGKLISGKTLSQSFVNDARIVTAGEADGGAAFGQAH